MTERKPSPAADDSLPTRAQGQSARGPLVSPIGVALAGGAAQGAIYEIGALRALDEALEGFDLVDAGIFVGVSAGGFLSACMANGLSTDQMCRAIVKDELGEHPFVPENFFRPATKEIGQRLLKAPGLIGSGLMRFATRREKRLLDALTGVGSALPTGIFDNEPMREYVAKIFDRPGRTDDFRELNQRLAVVATDIESGEATVFGRPGWDHVPISKAVQATTALPGLYPPVEIDGRRYVDGILRRTMHASVALNAGAKMVFCINPVVPVDTRQATRRMELPEGYLIDQGLPAVLGQTIRTMIHSRMNLGLRSYDKLFPEASVLLIEPSSDDHRIFFSNIFSFSMRRVVCERAYVATHHFLRHRREEIEASLEPFGIGLNHDFLDDPAPDVWASVGLPEFGAEAPEVARPVPSAAKVKKAAEKAAAKAEKAAAKAEQTAQEDAVLSDLDGLLERVERLVEARRAADLPVEASAPSSSEEPAAV